MSLLQVTQWGCSIFIFLVHLSSHADGFHFRYLCTLTVGVPAGLENEQQWFIRSYTNAVFVLAGGDTQILAVRRQKGWVWIRRVQRGTRSLFSCDYSGLHVQAFACIIWIIREKLEATGVKANDFHIKGLFEKVSEQTFLSLSVLGAFFSLSSRDQTE